MLTDLGLGDLSVIFIVILILVGIFLFALLVFLSGAHKKLLNGVDRKVTGNVVHKDITLLEIIAEQYPDDPLGREARKCLKQWETLQSDLEKMSQDRKERRVRSFYHGNILPIIQYYKDITKP